MRMFSDFRLFERPPRPSAALARWVAWRWLFFGILFTVFTVIFVGTHYLRGELIHYVNESRNLTDDEARDLFALFLFGGGFFALSGLAGVLLLPKQ
jgi:uncharacterized membrane protein